MVRWCRFFVVPAGWVPTCRCYLFCVACLSPCEATYFSLLVQRKVGKRKHTPMLCAAAAQRCPAVLAASAVAETRGCAAQTVSAGQPRRRCAPRRNAKWTQGQRQQHPHPPFGHLLPQAGEGRLGFREATAFLPSPARGRGAFGYWDVTLSHVPACPNAGEGGFGFGFWPLIIGY